MPPVGRGESLLQLVALTSFAVAQPLLDMLGRYAEFLVAHQLTASELILLTAGIVLGPPLVLWLLVRLAAAMSARLGAALQLLLIASLVSLLMVQLLSRAAGLGAAPALAGALAAGVIAARSVQRRTAVRKFLSLAAVASLVFALDFLLSSSASRLLRQPAAAVPEAPATSTSSSASSRSDQATPLVLVVFDELPLATLLGVDGTIDAERFPHFAALAADAVFYSQATTVAAGTAYAVPALLTGRYPLEQRLPTHLDYPQNLFTLLAGSYQLHAHETLTRLCPQSLCGWQRPPVADRLRSLFSDLRLIFLRLVVPAGLATELPPITDGWRDFAAVRRPLVRGGVLGVERSALLDIPGLVASYLDEITADRSTLHYLHLELPHIPWRYLPSGIEYGPVSRSNFARGIGENTVWLDDDWLITLALQRHIAQVMYADQLLGRLVATLRAQRLYDDALLIVTADHGLSFQIGEPGRRLTENNVPEVAAVPLIVRAPAGKRGRQNVAPVELIDILPTITEVAGLPAPPAIDGRSLLDPGYAGRQNKKLSAPIENRRLVVPSRRIAAATLSAAKRIALAFPEPGLDGLFRIGPALDLLGRPAAELAQKVTGKVGVALTQPWLFTAVDLGSGFLPAQVEGTLRTGAEDPGRRQLVIAVNGIVRAVTHSGPERGAERFSALIPERSFVAGTNQVQIFVLEQGADGEPLLVPTIDRSGPKYALLRAPNGAVIGIEASNNTGCRLAAEAVVGEAHQRGLSFWGQARDPSGSAPVVVIMAFVADTLVWAGPTSERSSDDANPDFIFGLTRPLIPQGDASKLRLFGVIGDRCTELQIIVHGNDS